MSVPRILSLFVVAIIVIVSVGVLFLYFNRNALIKEAIVRIGSDILQTEVAVDDVNLDVLQYTITINNFSVKNPADFPQGEAIGFRHITVSLPREISINPVHIDTVFVVEPRVHFFHEENDNNLSKLVRSVQAHVPESTDDGETLLKIDTITINEPVFKVSSYLLSNRTATINAPDINLKNIGHPDGIPPSELADVVLTQIAENALKALSQTTDQLLDAANKVINNFSNQTSDAVEDATKAVDSFIKDAEKIFR